MSEEVGEIPNVVSERKFGVGQFLCQYGVIGSTWPLVGQGIGSNPVVGWHIASAINGYPKVGSLAPTYIN